MFKKVIKYISKTLTIIILTVLALVLITAGLLLVPSVQNQVAKIAVNSISKNTNIDFSFENFSFTKFNTIEIDGLHISDLQKDSLIDAAHIKVVLGKLNLNEMEINIDKICVNDFYMDHHWFEDHDKTNLMEIFKKKDNKNKKSKTFKICAKDIELNNLNYKYRNYRYPETPLAINFNDIDAKNGFAKARNLVVTPDSISLTADHASLIEKAGFNPCVNHADILISSTLMSFKNVEAETPTSDFGADVSLVSNSYKSYRHFNDSVILYVSIKPGSMVDTKDVAYFSSSLAGANNIVTIMSANANGYVNDLHVNDILIDLCDKSRLSLDLYIKNTLYKYRYLDIKLKELTTNADDLEALVVPAFTRGVCAPYHLSLPDEVHRIDRLSAKGTFKGKIQDFKTDINLTADNSIVDAKLTYQPRNTNDDSFTLAFNGKNINVGKIMNTPKISTLDANINATGTANRFRPKTYKVQGELNNVALEHITLKDVHASVENDSEELNASVDVFNENIFLEAYVSHFLNSQDPMTNISVNAQQVNLSKLTLRPLEENATTSFFINSNIEGTDIDKLSMETYVTNFKYSDIERNVNANDFSIKQSFNPNDNTKEVALLSDNLNINLHGNFSYKELPVILSNVTNYLLNETDKVKPLTNDTTYLTLSIDASKDFKTVSQFLPALSINDDISLYLDVKDDSHATLSLNTKEIQYKTLTISDLNIDAQYDTCRANAIVNLNNVYLDDDSKLSDMLFLSKSKWELGISNDTVTADIIWSDNYNNRNGNFNFYADISELPKIKVFIPDSLYMYSDTSLWTAKSDLISYDTNLISIRNLILQGDDASLIIDGNYSKNPNETLSATFDNINLNLFKEFLPKSLDLDGVINGKASMSSSERNQPVLFADINVNDIIINDFHTGNLYLETQWDDKKHSLNLDTKLVNPMFNDTIINITGNYYPKNNKLLDLSILIDSLNLELISSFTEKYIKNPYGFLSAGIKINDNIDNLQTNGEIAFHNAGFTINATNTQYSFNDKIYIKPDEFYLRNFKIHDNKDNVFNVLGTIKHQNWKDFMVDLATDFNNFIILDNTSRLNGSIYGDASISGNVKAKGKLNDIDVNADVSTNQGTDVTITVTTSKTASQKSFITFVSNTDEQENGQITANIPRSNSMAINAKANISDGTQINIVLPYNVGDMSITGSGEITYNQAKNGNYNMNGDYTVNSGEFRLNIDNFIRRNFTITKGGTIIFNGAPSNALLDLQAVYQVKASLQSIPTISDESLAQQRVQVNCIINLSGSLYDPSITFDIEMPNVDEDVKSMIYSAIDINDQAAVTQQVFSLLILKSFSFSSENTLASSISSNSVGLISSQLSEWISYLYKGIDVGVNYNPASGYSPEEFEVYVKTQFLDDRLIIDGNFGVQNRSTVQAGASNSFIGDVNIEYKLTPDGKMRIKAFNRTNEYSLFETNSPYTQGVGISYSTEYNKLSEIFNRK